MFRFTIRDVLWLTVVMGINSTGCESPTAKPSASASKSDEPPVLTPSRSDDDAGTRSLTFRVTKANEHLGHSTAIVGGHSVHTQWCDCARGSLIDTNEEFVVWWMNNEIRDLPFKFEEGKTYLISLNGDIEVDGMVRGKSVRATRVAKVEAVAQE
jgi:hypothetical protein